MLEAVWAASTVAQTLFLFRSFQLRRHWPALNVWLVASALETVIVAGTRAWTKPSTYFWAWLVCEGPMLAALVAAMLEVYRRRAERRLAMDRAGRWITGLGVGLALTWLVVSSPPLTWDWLLQAAFRARSMVAISLGASAAIILILYRVFPCPTASVVVRHHTVMAIYLAVLAVEAGAQSIAPQQYLRLIEIIAIGGFTMIFLVWAKIIGPVPPQLPPTRGDNADGLDAEQLRLEEALSRGRTQLQPREPRNE